MRKLNTLAFMCALAVCAAMTFMSCDKGGDDPVEYNKFTINGTTTEIDAGSMEYYGDNFSDTAENVFVGLAAGGPSKVRLDMLVPDGEQRLVTGKYTFADTFAPFTFTDDDDASEAYDDADETWLSITGGTVKVSVSGTGETAVYTIEVNCTLEGGGTVRGTFQGTMTWSPF